MYYDYLWRMLQPLGVYINAGYNAAELKALGAAMDKLHTQLNVYDREIKVESAVEMGLTAWESLFPMIPETQLERRREALEVLFRAKYEGCSRNALRQTLHACGVDVSLGETGIKFEIIVSFEKQMDITMDPVFQLWLLEQILPCHLNVIVVMDYVNVETGQTVHERMTLDYLRQRTQAQWEQRLGALS